MPAAAGIESVAMLPTPYDKGDPLKGRIAFGDCAECHSLEPAGSQENGPTLYRIYERPAALNSGFVYSEALRNSGYVWDLKRLDQWIFNPHETLPGTSMAFVGIRNDARRRDLLAYLVALAE